MGQIAFFDRLKLAWQVLVDSNVATRAAGEAPPVVEAPPPALVEAPPDGALQLLGLLQREGRFVDFLQEDVDAYSDAEIGNAARVVHQGCAKAVREHFSLSPISASAEGDAISLPAGFNPSEYRLTGNVVGEPPFSGTLNHRGWRASDVTLAKMAPGHDLSIIAPAEVEL